MGSKAAFCLLPVSQEVENMQKVMWQKAECGKELSDRLRALGESLICDGKSLNLVLLDSQTTCYRIDAPKIPKNGILGGHEGDFNELERSLSIILKEKSPSQPGDKHNKKLI